MFEFFKPGRVRLDAQTNSAGPGYHQYVCTLLDRVSRDGFVVWEDDPEADDTGYFSHRDRGQLVREMQQWFWTVAKIFTEGDAADSERVLVSMPLEAGFTTPGFALTPNGIWTKQEFAEAKGSEQAAERFFSWMTEGWTAQTFRDAAVAAMWTLVRWTAPVTDDDVGTHDYVLDMLSKSQELDPELPKPWREWLEIIKWSGTDSDRELRPVVAAHAAKTTGRLIGYRRDPIRHAPFTLASITLPGHLAEETEDEGGTAAWFDRDAVIRMSTFDILGSARNELPPVDGRTVEQWTAKNGPARIEACGPDAEDEGRHNYRALFAVPGRLLICSFNVPDETFEPVIRDWVGTIEFSSPDEAD
ncbi:MAG: hypothetical protein K2Q20_14195 [Phycisphaerales bacterium]|nr:hypothetical protein [Phycisphaerales bacterium]